MSQICAQSMALQRLVCTVVACMCEFTLPKSLASSAKSFIHAVITSGRSFIYIRHNIGPNTLPCGIPLVTLAEQEHFPFITTFCDLLFKNSFIQLCTFPHMQYPQSFLSKLVCGTLSKAFLKSR